MKVNRLLLGLGIGILLLSGIIIMADMVGIVSIIGPQQSVMTDITDAEPAISKETALRIANERFPGTNMSNYTSRLYMNDRGNQPFMAWDIDVPGSITNEKYGMPVTIVTSSGMSTTTYVVFGGIVTIDAMTGSIINVNHVV